MLQRDIEVFLKNRGFERGVKEVLMRLAEEQNDIRHIINECVNAISSVASTLHTLNVVADNMKTKIDRMAPKDDDARSTQSIAEGD